VCRAPRGRELFAAGRLDLRARDGARAQQHRRAAAAVDDGRLDAHVAGTAVDHQQAVAELVAHVLRGGRADAAEAVGAGARQAGHAQLGAGLQQRLRHRVRGAAQADGVLPAGGRAPRRAGA
jgi:hypothetical protein